MDKGKSQWLGMSARRQQNPRRQVLADNRSTPGCARASEGRADLGSAVEEHPGCRSCTAGRGGG